MKKTAKKTGPSLLINILYPQGIKQKFAVKFLKWLISYGRFIVVVVEVIVLATFVYRFKLDAEFSAIKDNIQEQVPYLESLAPDEALITQTGIKLATVKKTYISSPNFQQVLTDISSQMPTGITLNSIFLEPVQNTPTTNFRLIAQAGSNSDIAIFLNGLKNQKGFKNISLVNINFDQGTIIFTVIGTKN